ncbi:MFS transporter [Patulibacter sp. SYSU D01012]|uniref:MFS transporter n=1 Tax=Patulibacter sp. SYSU D01012 TaxID=2817381 RepID=UPI001B30E1B2|nr:MFS transporter [Patulibacter sp. SYSU D01012]
MPVPDRPVTAPDPGTPARRGALAGLALAVLAASLATSVANVALPTLADAFDASFQRAQWVVLAYLLASTTLLVAAGRLGDLLGRRRLLLASLVVFTAASALCAAAPTLGTLVAARALQGLGAAAVLGLGVALVAEAVPEERTGRAMGLVGTMSAVGTAAGPSLGGVLVSVAGWRGVFALVVPVGAAAVVLVAGRVPGDGPRRARPASAFDVRGTVLLAVGLALYTLAMTLGDGDPGLANAAALGAAGVTVALFAAAQRRAAAPLVPRAVLRSRTLRAGLSANGLVATVMMTTLVVGPFYLTEGLGLGPAATGLVMSVGPAVAALTSTPAGRLTDRVGAPRARASALAALVAGATALAILPTAAGVAGYVAPLVVVTAGYALFGTANNAAVMAGAPADGRGVAGGVLALTRNLGLITGASVMGAVFALAAGTSDVRSAAPAAVAQGTRVTFLVAVGLLTVALGLVLAARRVGAGPRRAAPTP